MKICQTLNDFQMVLVICPCCGDISRLADCRMETSTFSSDVDELSELMQERKSVEFLSAELRRNLDLLVSDETEISEKLSEAKKEAKEAGRKDAKLKLLKIDPHFSGRDIDPQDVRVLFDPIEYVVFSRMTGDGLDKIELIGREPKSSQEEKVCRSIDETITRGDVDFEVLNVNESGGVDCDKGASKPVRSKRKRTSLSLAA